MRYRLATIPILCLASFVLCSSAITEAERHRLRTDEKGGSFVTLFNGKDLTGWHGQETADPRKLHSPQRRQEGQAACPWMPRT